VDGKHSPTSAQGLIFDVQRFSLHDGPGIRTTVFFKGCPLRCRWCQNPESLSPRPEVAFYAGNCRACFRCASECPQDAILKNPDGRIDFSRCDGCGRCARVCPHDGLRRVGQWWPVTKLVEEILKDRDYYDDSGGGVTLSGGEPTVQAAFLARLLPPIKARGLHVTLQTCGLFPWEPIAPLVPLIDLVYFDLKHMDPETHEHYTGTGNRRILDNFDRFAAAGTRLQPRMPVIPGVNDQRANIAATARRLRQNGLKTIHCLPYHDLGQAKLRRIRADLKPLTVRGSIETAMMRIQAAFQQEGIHAIVDD
jgi:pyruvate formate lyase activating enzyme